MPSRISPVWSWFAGLALASLGVLIAGDFIVIFPTCAESAFGYCVVPNLFYPLEQLVAGSVILIGGILVALIFGRIR